MAQEARGMGKVTASAIYRVIADAEQPVITVAEMADELDVTEQTIRNHLEGVEGFDDIRSETKGQTTVYWHVDKPLEGPVDERFTIGQDIGLNPVHMVMIERRAKWLYASQRVQEWRDEKDPIELRSWFWEQTMEYFSRSGLKTILEIESKDEDGVDYKVKESSLFVEDFDGDIEHYAFDAHLFTSGWYGRVEGIHGLRRFDSKYKNRLKEIAAGDSPSIDEDLQNAAEAGVVSQDEAETIALVSGDTEFDEDKISRQDYDELLPSLSDMIAVGQTIDHLVADTFNLRW